MTIWQLRKILERAGVSVAGTASNGEDGIAVVMQEKPDIVLMDITMPRMNGLDAARHILTHMNTCIIMVTAYDEYRAEAEAAGVSGYITKPVVSVSLVGELSRAFVRFQSRHQANGDPEDNSPPTVP